MELLKKWSNLYLEAGCDEVGRGWDVGHGRERKIFWDRNRDMDRDRIVLCKKNNIDFCRDKIHHI